VPLRIFRLPPTDNARRDRAFDFQELRNFFTIYVSSFSLTWPQLKLEDLMGLVSELKEQARCKVMLILNEEELGAANEAIYARYAEKVPSRE
jgi:hypothetical protein